MTPPDEDQVPAEAFAQASVGGPLPTLDAWLSAVREWRRWERAMAVMTPELRLACAQAFICQAEDAHYPVERSDAARLAACDSSTPAVGAFCATWQDAMDDSFAGWPPVTGVGGQPRPVDLAHELLLVVPYEAASGPTVRIGARQARRMNDGASTGPRHKGFLLRRVPEEPGGWLVAGWNYDRQPQPGWPPQL